MKILVGLGLEWVISYSRCMGDSYVSTLKYKGLVDLFLVLLKRPRTNIEDVVFKYQYLFLFFLTNVGLQSHFQQSSPRIENDQVSSQIVIHLFTLRYTLEACSYKGQTPLLKGPHYVR